MTTTAALRRRLEAMEQQGSRSDSILADLYRRHQEAGQLVDKMPDDFDKMPDDFDKMPDDFDKMPVEQYLQWKHQ